MDFQLNLKTEPIQQVFCADPLCVPPTLPVRQVMGLMAEKNRGCVLICRDEALIGIFTERDALRLMASAGANLDQEIERLMVPEPVSVRKTETMGAAIAKMSDGGYRRLPVVDEQNRPLGVLKVSGILHYFVEHFPGTIYTLPPEPRHVTQHREGA